jgi:hypothetical protein
MSKRPDINFIPMQEVAPPGGYLKVSRICVKLLASRRSLVFFLQSSWISSRWYDVVI